MNNFNSKHPYTITIEVIFRDIDSFGHVNNAVYFTYLETARTKYFQKLKNQSGLEQMNMIVASASCNYKSPALIEEKLHISVGITRLGTKSFDFIYRIQSEKGRQIADAKTVQVAYDYKTQNSIILPEKFKSTVLEMQRGLYCPDK